MNKKLEELLLYVGTAGAIVSALAYIIIISVLVVGIESSMEIEQLLLVSTIGAVAGVLIVGMLRSQGKMFAEKEDVSQAIMKQYFKAINKNKPRKKLHTISWFMVKSIVGDIMFKGLSVAAMTYFSVTVFMSGNGDFALIGLAFANTLMFISFGILAMRKSYMFYLNEHLPAIQQIIENLNAEVKNGNQLHE